MAYSFCLFLLFHISLAVVIIMNDRREKESLVGFELQKLRIIEKRYNTLHKGPNLIWLSSFEHLFFVFLSVFCHDHYPPRGGAVPTWKKRGCSADRWSTYQVQCYNTDTIQVEESLNHWRQVVTVNTLSCIPAKRCWPSPILCKYVFICSKYSKDNLSRKKIFITIIR